jgi:hypothetical protein
MAWAAIRIAMTATLISSSFEFGCCPGVGRLIGTADINDNGTAENSPVARQHFPHSVI